MLSQIEETTRPPAGQVNEAAQRMAGPAEDDSKRRTNGIMRRFGPIALMVLALVLFFVFGLDRYLSFEQLREHRGTLAGFVAENGVLAALAFIAVYALATAISLPGGAVLTLSAGFLFGIVAGTVYAVIGATVGATGVFLAARTALGDSLRRRAGPAVRRMEQGFRDHALSYLLFLRLVPLFPFWLVNLVPAVLGVPLRTYVIGTFLGIIPGGFVYASVGNGLGAIFDAGRTPDLSIIFDPEILLPILGLALLALVPVIYKRVKARRGGNSR
jgi:uncharacterized membrane protein YdjX (TVP38/TMEM64 family)